MWSPNEDSNQPAHTRSLIWVFLDPMIKTLHRWLSTLAPVLFWSDCVYAQSDWNLRWVHMSDGTLSDNEVKTKLPWKSHIHYIQPSQDTEWRRDDKQTITRHNRKIAITDIERKKNIDRGAALERQVTTVLSTSLGKCLLPGAFHLRSKLQTF